MKPKANDQFFWVKSGSEKKSSSIQSIQKDSITGQPKQRPHKYDGSLNAARSGLKEGWIRATFIVNEDNLKKLKALAYWERRGIKDVLNNALTAYLTGKDIKPIPPKQEG
jgi:hypothetical protein